MRFSEIQKKEVIDGKKGAFLGFIQDATINIDNGTIDTFHVGDIERGLLFGNHKNEVHKILMKDVTVIGKDIILVGKNQTKLES